ncbi:MAG: PorV/PorQ family protein [Candidatus Zixiibacteriota bacterium]|nr:MAG: PorV/PorQ family protein [candidate division Zixibacteria bacterium]
MNKKIVIILTVAFLCGTVSAGEFSKVGTAGAQFLKIGVGSRYTAMAEASVACANDIYSMYWNPAGLANVYNNELAFSHVYYIADINLNYVAYARSFEDIGIFGVSATVLGMDDQEVTTTEPDEQNGTGEMYSVSSHAVQLTYARYLTTRFAFGGSFKYVSEKIYREKSDGFAFDFGTLLYTGLRSLRIGMSISNMGPEMRFDGPDLDVFYKPEDESENPNYDPFTSRLKVEPYDLPLTFRVGLAYDLAFGTGSNLLLAIEAKHPNDNEQQGAIGAEYSWQERYFLRGGYKLNYEEESLTFGGGIRTDLSETVDFIIDYAWVDFGRFHSVHRFSASISF